MPVEFAVGVDFGGTSAKVGLVGRGGEILGRDLVEIDPRADFRHIVDPVADRIRALVRRSVPGGRPLAVGLGTPGFVDSRTGVVMSGAENIPALKGNSVAAALGEALGLPAFADNDATCAAAGELCFGAGKSLRHFALVTLGTGVGGGLVLDGRVYRGSRGFAGEIGHICLDPGGLWCNCGSRGCLEQYASAPAIARIFREKLGKREREAWEPTAKDVFQRAAQGDPEARDAVEEAARSLAQAFGTLLNVLNLEAFLIGGGVSQAGEQLCAPVRRHLPDFTWPTLARETRILTAALLNDAGLLGAAATAYDRIS